MIAMHNFRFTLIILWASGCIAAWIYSQQQDIPRAAAVPLAAAFLVELSLYSAMAFPVVRERCERLGRRLGVWLVASAIAPYCLYSAATGTFRWTSLALLALLAAAAGFWFVILPRKRVWDVAFLVLMAGVYLLKLFRDIYASPVEGLRIDVLGQLMWIRLGVMAVLAFRRQEGIGFGFLPTPKEWKAGAWQYLCFLPPGVALMFVLNFGRFQPEEGLWWKAPATFAGVLWVVALSEEFFFRGMLQQWITAWIGPWAGLAGASALFGCVHLWFRDFPNWKFALLAALAGLFYGRAYQRTGGIRAAMVTHSLVVTTWRMLAG